MSKFGKIVELRFSKENSYKQIFPIVYENKTKWYCKRYGSDDLVNFYKDSHMWRSVKYKDIATFLKDYQEKPWDFRDCYITIYLSPECIYDFPMVKNYKNPYKEARDNAFMDVAHLESEIKHKKNLLEDLPYAIKKQEEQLEVANVKANEVSAKFQEWEDKQINGVVDDE